MCLDLVGGNCKCVLAHSAGGTAFGRAGQMQPTSMSCPLGHRDALPRCSPLAARRPPCSTHSSANTPQNSLPGAMAVQALRCSPHHPAPAAAQRQRAAADKQPRPQRQVCEHLHGVMGSQLCGAGRQAAEAEREGDVSPLTCCVATALVPAANPQPHQAPGVRTPSTTPLHSGRLQCDAPALVFPSAPLALHPPPLPRSEWPGCIARVCPPPSSSFLRYLEFLPQPHPTPHPMNTDQQQPLAPLRSEWPGRGAPV